jgi:hypothetical protein
MQKELKMAGFTANFAAVNSIDAVANQADLTSKADFPMFQDVEAVKAWEQHGGGKDDFYIYGTDGKLVHYLKFGGPVNTDLTNPDAYAAVKKLVSDTK